MVVDANIVFASVIRDGATREVILDRDLDLWGRRNSRAALHELLRQIRERIIDIPEAAIEAERVPAPEQAGKAGRKDAPYVAAVLAADGRLWTHDETLAEEGDVPTVSTGELLEEDP